MKTKPDYRRYLEMVAKRMILVHKLDTLIKLILRAIVRNVHTKHAVLFLHDQGKDEYVAHVSRGKEGLKIPSGFAKIRKDNPLIRYFTEKELNIFGRDFLILDRLNYFISSKKAKKDKKLKSFLENVRFQFSLYNAKACLPGFFEDKLICLFLLGQKHDRKVFTQDELGYLSVLSSDAVMAIQNARLFEDLKTQLEHNRTLFLQTVKALATAIESKDKYTSGHTERVSIYSMILAQELKSMGKISRKDWDKFVDDLKIASLLHDIGKIGVKETVLNKNGFLNDEERLEMQKHPLVGFSILNQVDEFQEPILGVKYHHERYDGGGYPEGLKGKNIPLIAQVISIVDTFDALTTDRPYRKGLLKEEAIKIIEENKGKQFSPLIVEAFLKIYNSGKI
jgi:HD-GYP domain-containing protein (c-di-GMP phosphodiesterase class II)